MVLESDTSSDELDGHYFFYGLYYDLVAETEAERDAVRAHVAAITDHLLAHDYCLVDHDGLPTRWAVFSPRELNFNRQWFAERGLNSLSMLAYLAVAEHVTRDAPIASGDVSSTARVSAERLRAKIHNARDRQPFGRRDGVHELLPSPRL